MHATDADSTISEYQLIDGSDEKGSEFFEINSVSGEERRFKLFPVKISFFGVLKVPQATLN